MCTQHFRKTNGFPAVDLFSGNAAVESNRKQKISSVHSLSLLVLEQYEAREESCQISLWSSTVKAGQHGGDIFLLKEAGYEDIKMKTFSSGFRGGIAEDYMARLFGSNRNRYVSPETQKYILSQKL